MNKMRKHEKSGKLRRHESSIKLHKHERSVKLHRHERSVKLHKHERSVFSFFFYNAFLLLHSQLLRNLLFNARCPCLSSSSSSFTNNKCTVIKKLFKIFKENHSISARTVKFSYCIRNSGSVLLNVEVVLLNLRL